MKTKFQKFAEAYKAGENKFNKAIDTIMETIVRLIFGLVKWIAVIVFVIIICILVGTVINSCGTFRPDE